MVGIGPVVWEMSGDDLEVNFESKKDNSEANTLPKETWRDKQLYGPKTANKTDEV
jgi:hypothetical protein